MTRVLGALIAVFILTTFYLSITVSERQAVLRKIAHHNDTWAVSQTVQEFMRLEASFALYRMLDQNISREDVRLRSDIMISRLVSLREGTLKSFVEETEDRRKIVSIITDIVETIDRDLNTLNNSQIGALLARMHAITGPLTNLSSQSVQQSWMTVESNLESLRLLQRTFLGVVSILVLCWFGLLIVLLQRNSLLAASKRESEILNSNLNSTSDELRIKNRSLEYAAYHDSLTALPNRALFWSELDIELSRLSSNGGSVSLLLIDLDEFRSVNDTLGHDAGDRLLVQVSDRLRNFTHKSHMFCRLGGDEFACLLLNRTAEESIAYAHQIAKHISAPYNLLDQRAEIGCSIGIARTDQFLDIDTQLLFKRADIALYSSKASDTDRVCAFEDFMQSEFDDRKMLETDLHQAVCEKEIKIVFQAQINTRTNKVIGMEALARWSHPVRGDIPPSIFIPVAEEIGVIRELGRMILLDACREAATWKYPLTIAVNLSSIQLRSPDILDIVQDVLSITGLNPNRLELEITESVLLSNQEHILSSIAELRSMGVRIAMDDFGTGYSSLAVLRRIPFDIIKIDKAFIKDIVIDKEAEALLKLVIDIGSLLGKNVVVEGIETIEQFNIIKKIGNVIGQGYLFSQPESVSDIVYLRETDWDFKTYGRAYDI